MLASPVQLRRRGSALVPTAVGEQARAGLLIRLFDVRALRLVRGFRLLLRRVAGPVELQALALAPSLDPAFGLLLRSAIDPPFGRRLDARPARERPDGINGTSALVGPPATSRLTVKRRDAQLRGDRGLACSPLADAPGQGPRGRPRPAAAFRSVERGATSMLDGMGDVGPEREGGQHNLTSEGFI
jgi:hypothetical protein